MKSKNRKFPLYDPKIFHDACGTGFIVSKSGQPDKRILSLALKSLKKLSHRGAASSDNKSGDGSGIMTDLPVKFFKLILKNAGVENYETPEVKGLGLNVVTGKTVDMVKAGIIDPLLVTKSALMNAASVATTILSTDCVINNVRDESNR